MRCITLTEPWATLVAIGAKRIETRSWAAPRWLLGQQIAIHAAKGMKQDDLNFSLVGPCATVLRANKLRQFAWAEPVGPVKDAFPTTRGRVIATATLYACREIPNADIEQLLDQYGFPEHELDFGNYAPGRYAWFLRDVRRIDPVAARGELGLWEWDPPAELRGAA